MSEDTMVFISALVTNVMVGALVAGAIWYTGSAWALVGLVFLSRLRTGEAS